MFLTKICLFSFSNQRGWHARRQKQKYRACPGEHMQKCLQGSLAPVQLTLAHVSASVGLPSAVAGERLAIFWWECTSCARELCFPSAFLAITPGSGCWELESRAACPGTGRRQRAERLWEGSGAGTAVAQPASPAPASCQPGGDWAPHQVDACHER